MKVKMRLKIAGTRDGVAYPDPGGVMDLPKNEAQKLLDAGFATPVADKDADVERAVADDSTVEKRGPGRPRKTAESS